ncbi:MAG TPA: DUF192 domain-containing protein [Actinomycetota bacterium]|nr:DUF192 domain-containing protein [Actinomycetota bacterium]
MIPKGSAFFGVTDDGGMTQRRRSLLLTGMAAVVLALAAVSCGSDGTTGPSTRARSPRATPSSPRPLPKATLRVLTTEGPLTLRVEIADTPQARGVGLMKRRRLAPNAGMAFLFDGPTTNRFWMKNTLIPLSIAFWDEAGRIVSIVDMAPCRKDPCPLYSAGTSYIGAVEVNRGFFKAHGVKVGDRVELER